MKPGFARIAFLLLAPFFAGGTLPSSLAAADESRKEPSREERVRALQNRNWEVRAVRVEGELRVDGRLDDPVWEQAGPITEFYQRERNEGLPATERTEVRVVYDRTNLYLGFRCYDSQPQLLQARSIFRDENASADDLLIIMIDAFHDHRSAFQFVTNANGLVQDTLQTGETAETRNQDWDTVWNARGSRNPAGWEAEVVIPFKSLRFEPPAPGQEVVFGIGFKRNIPRKNEEAHWPFVSNDSTWYRPAELGHLRGLQDIQPGRNLEIRPYALGGVSRDFMQATTDGRKDGGLDVKWGLTPGLTADFTLNTDFAQEEVDLQQINFTRFSLFFPEKRQFFLEGQRMFQFGLPREADLVFTRRIGLSNAGEIVSIRAGGRLSGRQGRLSIGAMNIQTGEARGLPSENFTVLRVRRDLFRRSSVGVLFTNREGGGSFNRLLGADVNLLFKKAWFLEGFLARMDEPGKTPGASAAYARFAYEADRLGASYRFLDIGEAFRPGVGFVRRPDSRENLGEVRFSPRPRSKWVRQFHLKGSLRYITNRQNALETRERDGEFTTEFESGDAVSLKYTDRFEFIGVPFRLRAHVLIPAGGYHLNTFEARLQTFTRRQARLNLIFNTGGFWGGGRDTLSFDTNYRISKHFGINGKYEVNWVDLPQRKFTTHLVSSRFQFAFRPDLVLLSLFQYNHDTGLLSTNLRFNWIPKPGTDFFIVYNELDEWSSIFGVKSRSLAVKLNYLFAL